MLRTETIFNIKTSNYKNTSEYISYKNFCDEKLSIKLRDYQYEASYLLAMAKSGFDFSVPGAGKTIISYATYLYFKYNSKVKKLLVIGPKNAYNAWYDEYTTCFGVKPNFENLSNKNLNHAKNYFSASQKNQKEITFINVEKIRSLQKEIIIYLNNNDCLLV